MRHAGSSWEKRAVLARGSGNPSTILLADVVNATRWKQLGESGCFGW